MSPFHVLSFRPHIDRSLMYRLHIQKYSLSCEVAALQIIMSALGMQVSEDDIFSQIPQYPFPYASGGIWWDPDHEFVGFYTGWQAKKTGYGIYEAPLANYVRMHNYSASIMHQSMYSGTMNPETQMSLLLQALDTTDTHILLWWDWCTDPQYEDGVLRKWGSWILEFFPLPGRNHCDRFADARQLKWTTPQWKSIIWLSGEHTFVLLGYVGTYKKPSHIIVWDTYTGRHVYPYAEWMRKWSRMDNRSLLISRIKSGLIPKIWGLL